MEHNHLLQVSILQTGPPYFGTFVIILSMSILLYMSLIFIGSGSQDGMLCVWDLSTGACVYSIQAHDGAILSLVEIQVVSLNLLN